MSFAEDAPRRFYKEATVKHENGAFAVLLDGRALRTPKKAPLAAPTLALAEAIAGEWAAQGEFIRSQTMPLTRLANVALDFTPAARAEMIAGVARYAETDLLSHRADRPAGLVARQQALWDPLLAWAENAIGVRLTAAPGLLAHEQPAGAGAVFAAAAGELGDFALTGLAHAAGLAGSAVIAFALARGALSGEQAFGAAAVDELHQLEVWGEDGEARERLERLRGEFIALESFFAALA